MEDIAKERANSKLDTEQLTCLLYGGEMIVQRKRKISKLIAQDPELHVAGYEFLSREEKYDLASKLTVYSIKTKFPQLGITHPLEQAMFFREVIGISPPVDFTERIFFNTVKGQGTQEQKDKWLPLAATAKILTCYAQTELAHGTFIRGLETTATYDPSREEFVIHSPTLTSTKWWSGSLGIMATHAIVVAKLITQGEDKGTHNFIVQVRSMENHEPLKGITIGDIGPKFGFEEKDNGYVRFDHFRIPRENMLMRHSQVAPDGTYTRPLSSKLGYGSMVQLRTTISYASFDALARAITIAVRYSVVRRQTQNRAGAPETQLLDYINQQFILLPLLATAYATYFVARRIISLYSETQAQLAHGNLQLLPELHASSSGLKAISTTVVSQGIEACRVACGGHGYSQCSGFPTIYSNTSAAMTYEGDNNILLLQTARYLIKMKNEVIQDPSCPLPDNLSYLRESKCTQRPYSLVFLSSQQQLSMYKGMVRASVDRALARVQEGERRGLDAFDAWNGAAVELIQSAEAHTYYVIVKSFVESIELSEIKNLGFETQRILKRLSDIFALHYMLQKSGVFLESGVINGPDIVELRSVLVSLLGEIRTDAVCLVDAFDFPDYVLRSVLGRYDGDVYRAMWEWVQHNPRNKHPGGVHPVYHKYTKQLLNAKL